MFNTETLHHFTAMLAAYKDVAWQVLQILFLVVMALSVLRILNQALKSLIGGDKRSVGKRYGLLQVNRGVTYERKRSLASRRRLGLFQDKEDDGLTAETSEPATLPAVSNDGQAA